MDFQPYLDWLRDQQKLMQEQVIAWANINSSSYHLAGLARMLDSLKQSFATLSNDIEVITLQPMQRVNQRGVVEQQPLGQALRIRKRPEAPLQVLLCGHMDTVYGENDPFQSCNWLDANTLHGPGVTDMKGGLTVMLYALQALERSPVAQQIGWEVLIDADEEIGSYGSAPLLEQAAKRNHLGLIFEPAMQPDGTLAGERKGTGNFVVVAHGKAAHAGREPHLGRNAIRPLADFIAQADDLNRKNADITVNIGCIEGGGATNIVPDLAIAYIDVRTKQASDETWLEQSFHSIIDSINQRDGIRLELHGSFSRKPKPLAGKTLRLFELVQQVGRELGLNLSWQPSGGCCDGNNLAAAGLAVVDTLGVRGGKIHSPDEYLLVDSLVERAQLTALLLMKLALAEILH